MFAEETTNVVDKLFIAYLIQVPTEPLKARLKVQQQSRPETLEAARQIYLEAGIDAEVAPFFRDMAQRLSQAHLVIGRAGASTCSELAVTGVPSLLIPLGIAMDDHQRFNAASRSGVPTSVHRPV